MKRFLLITVLTMSCIITQAQQTLPKDFFDLKFDEKYSTEDLKKHLDGNGSFVRETGTFDIGPTTYNGYSFSNVTYLGRCYPLMTLMTLSHGTLGGIAFTFTKDDIKIEGQTLDKIYDELKKDLKEQYGELSEFPVDGRTDISRLLNINNGVTLRLDKWTSDGETSQIEFSYISLTAPFVDEYKAMYPTIQDTFMGIRIGTKQTTYSIKSAVGYKGNYLDENYDSFGKNITFTKMSFAGRTWDFGSFSLTDKGEFYRICAYDSLKDGYGYDDEKRDANNTYESYKSKLDDKYGVHDERESDDGKYVIYIGENNVAIILSNERGKSTGGEYRRYIKITYYQTEIFNKLSEKSSDEL